MSDLVKYSKDSMFQRIKASYLDDTIVLNDAEEDKKLRLSHAFALRHRNKYSRFQVVEKLRKEYNISQAQAYRDYNLAMQLHGDLDAADKRAERMIIAEAYWELYLTSFQERDFDSARKALDSYTALFDFGSEENAIDPNKIQAHEYHIHMSREGNRILKEALKGGVVDFMSVTAEDVDFKEVEDDSE